MLCLLSFTFASPARSDEADWVLQKSDTGLYSVKLPAEHKTQITSFPIGKNLVVKSEDKTISIDQRPYQNVVKTYIVKTNQTLGPPLAAIEIDAGIDQTLDLYEKAYKARGGVVKNKTKNDVQGFKSGQIELAYDDPRLGLQTLRARVIFTPQVKYQLVAIGNENMMSSFKTRDFFDDFLISKFTQGPVISNEVLTQDFPSRGGLFIAHMPQNNKIYFPAKPASKTRERDEVMNFSFQDPVRNQKLFLNIYAYNFDKDLTFKNAQEVLAQRHIFKQRDSIENLKIDKSFDASKRSMLTTQYSISPIAGFPFINQAKLKCVFTGNKMVVAEFLGSATLVGSDFSDNLLQNIDFLPGVTAVPSPASASP